MTIERPASAYSAVNAVGPMAELPVYEPAADIMRIAGVVRRQYRLALAGALFALVLAAALLFFLQPWYKSTVRILLDQDRSRLLTEISGEQAPASTEEYMATQIAVMGSEIVVRRAIHNLGLVYDPGTRRLSIASPPVENGPQARPARVTSEYLSAEKIDPGAVAAVQRAVSIYQVEKSLVVEITANDPDPEIAQKIAAAYGQAYLTDQLSARFEATKSAGSWLEERINTLRQQSQEANAAVETFRAQNNLVSTDGRLVSDQQLGSLNDQLVATKLAVTRARAKVDVFETAVEKNDVEAIIGVVGSTAEIADSAPIKALRNDYLEVSQRARDVKARWGEDNDQSKVLQAEMNRQAGLVLEEAKRILEGFRSDLRTVQREADETELAVVSATGQSKADNSTLVTLRSLEQRSAASNALYQDYLARYQEAVQQQTLQLTVGRLISEAELPGVPYFPSTKLILAFMLLLGAGAGGALGVGRELLDRTFRSRSDVERRDLDFLGYLATPSPRGGRRKRLSLPGLEVDAAPSLVALAGHFDRSGSALATIRSGVEIRRRGSSRVVAMVSLEPNMARSALALALAAREARSGRRVLLVDGDGTEAALSRSLMPDGVGALAEVLSGARELKAAVTPLGARLSFLSSAKASGAASPVSIPAEHLKTWGMEFDLVVIDLPPAGPISEARALAPAVDGYVCAVKWGATPRDLLQAFTGSSSNIKNKTVGVVITDVNMKRQHLYDAAIPREAQARAA